MPTRTVGLATVGDTPPTPQKRAEALRDRQRALRDPERYYAAVGAAFASQRRRSRTGATAARPQARPRGAGRPSARRTSASSTTSGSDPGEGEPAEPPAAAVHAVAEAWTAPPRRRRPDYSRGVRP